MKKIMIAMSFLIGLGLANAQQTQSAKMPSKAMKMKTGKAKKASTAKMEMKKAVTPDAKSKKDEMSDKKMKKHKK